MPSASAVHSPPAGRTASPDATLRWIELAEQVCQAGRVLGANLAQHASPSGLSEAQFSLLFACGRGPEAGFSQSELAAALNVSPAHVSGLVEQLRGQGWLAGERRAPDRRKQVWRLTAQGDAQLTELLANLTAWAERLQRHLGAQRCDELSRLLAELVAAAREAEPTNLALYTPVVVSSQEGACS